MERISVDAVPQESQHLGRSMPKQLVSDRKTMGYRVGDVAYAASEALATTTRKRWLMRRHAAKIVRFRLG